jgi:hypothetical protein
MSTHLLVCQMCFQCMIFVCKMYKTMNSLTWFSLLICCMLDLWWKHLNEHLNLDWTWWSYFQYIILLQPLNVSCFKLFNRGRDFAMVVNDYFELDMTTFTKWVDKFLETFFNIYIYIINVDAMRNLTIETCCYRWKVRFEWNVHNNKKGGPWKLLPLRFNKSNQWH